MMATSMKIQDLICNTLQQDGHRPMLIAQPHSETWPLIFPHIASLLHSSVKILARKVDC